MIDATHYVGYDGASDFASLGSAAPDRRHVYGIMAPRMYQLIRQPGPITEHTFEIEFLDPGAAPHVFTFG